MFVVKKNTAKPFYVVFDGVTGLSITAKLSKNGGASGTVSPTISDLGGGLYAITPSTSHRDTLGHQAWTFSASGQSDRWYAEQVVEYDPESVAVGALTTLGTNAPTGWLNSAAFADGFLTATKIAADAITATKIQDSSFTSAKFADAFLTAAKLALDATKKIANEGHN